MAQYGIKEVMNFTIAKYDPNPLLREPLLSVDYAQVTGIENSGERVDISGGRGNKKLLSFDHSKTTALNITLPLVDLKMLAMISGDDMEDTIKDIFKREVLLVQEDGTTGSTYVELGKAPINNSLYIYTLEGSRDLKTRLTATATSGTVGDHEYELDTSHSTPKLILNPDSNPEGSEVVVYYHTTTTNSVMNLQINPEKFPKTISIYGDTLFRNQYTEEDEVYNLVAHKGRIRPQYTLTMNATDTTVLEITVDLYAVKDQATGDEVYIEYIKDEE